MERRLGSLDLHFRLPQVNQVDAARPFAWLARGFADMRAHPVASLAYGAFFAAAGYLILAYAADMPHLFSAAIGGFLLLGPLAAAGLYEISRRHAAGAPAGLADSLSGIRRNAESVAYFGLFLALVAIGWERLSAILFALFFRDGVPELSNFLAHVAGAEQLQFVAVYLIAALIVGGVAFALMAFAVPMVMHCGSDNVTAAMTSARAVSNNLRAMAVWAGLILVLMGIGFATWMLAMVVVVPLLGHATWHGYRELIAEQ